MKFDSPVWMLLVLMSLVMGTPGSAQENGEAEEEDSPRTIADIAGESDRIEGLFTLFRNRESGETHLLIKPDQLNREFITSPSVSMAFVRAAISGEISARTVLSLCAGTMTVSSFTTKTPPSILIQSIR